MISLISGKANLALAKKIADHLALPLQEAASSFSDGETRVQLKSSIRGHDVFIVQPTCNPVNHHLMELLILIDAAKRASAARITAVVPYYGYARQERKTAGREPISAKLVANLITVAGADRLLTVDLHAPAIEGFFDIPVDHLRADKLLAAYVEDMYDRPVVIAPDSGAFQRVLRITDLLTTEVEVGVMSKRRSRADASDVVHLIGHVDDRRVVIVDDLISTGGTLVGASDYLLQAGALSVDALVVHPVLAHGASSLAASRLRKIIVTDTIPHSNFPSKFDVLSVAPLLAAAINRIHTQQSVSVLFRNKNGNENKEM